MDSSMFFATAVVFIGCFQFISKRLLRYLRYLQQDDYSAKRFLSWVKIHRAYDTRGTIVSIISFVVVSTFLGFYLGFLSLGIVLFVLGRIERDPQIEGKKKLVLTKRANSIYVVGQVLAAFLIFAMILSPLPALLSIVILCQSPILILVGSVISLGSREKKLQRKFKQEAHEKFLSIAPVCVGVTGSFGKTSVKNMLGEILSMSLGSTFYPQAGVNTEMGITREIREKMSPAHRFAVIEMGAYHEGSIARLCQLTPVNAAIVTAVHLMHLDRFGGEEHVYRAKSELPKALGGSGVLVVNGDNSGARRMATEFRTDKTYLYGLDDSAGALDCQLKDSTVTRQGTSFTVVWKGRCYQGFIKMHGRGALSNLLASFTMAVALGADPELVLAVARNLEPVSNRLEVKDYGEYIQINDAYNSNPIGFGYALDVLRDLPGQRRILITPGMIELGDRQFSENKKIALVAAKICDLVMVVNQDNRQAFIEGLTEGGMPSDAVVTFERRDQALAHLAKIRASGDIVLLENDLPDLNEFVEVF